MEELNVFTDLPGAIEGLALLSLYETVWEYEPFCFRLGIDPDDEASQALYDAVHNDYVRVWTALGSDEFGQVMAAHRKYA